MAVINNGVIEQLGTPIEVYEKPASRFVAEFIGSPQMNFINGTIKNDYFESKSLKLNTDLNIDNANVNLGFRAEDLEIKEGGEISLNIDIIEKLGSDSIIYGSNKNGESICYKESGNTKLGIGENINISLTADNFHVFDEKTDKRQK